MKLKTRDPESSWFFLRNKRMFLDSCIVIELTKKKDVAKLISEAGKIFTTYISAVSMLEVGFGPSDIADKKQQDLAMSLYFNESIINVSSSSIDSLQTNKSGQKYLYIPESHEWYGARHKLIKWMDNEKTGGSSARKQANDALIFMCAWNANSFLVTENVADFTRFNKIMLEDTSMQLPIFTLKDLFNAKKEVVYYPDNI